MKSWQNQQHHPRFKFLSQHHDHIEILDFQLKMNMVPITSKITPKIENDKSTITEGRCCGTQSTCTCIRYLNICATTERNTVYMYMYTVHKHMCHDRKLNMKFLCCCVCNIFECTYLKFCKNTTQSFGFSRQCLHVYSHCIHG